MDFGAYKRIGDWSQGFMCPCLEVWSDGSDKGADAHSELTHTGMLRSGELHAIGYMSWLMVLSRPVSMSVPSHVITEYLGRG